MGPVIYLDIDGVLSPRNREAVYELDPELPKTLARQCHCPAIETLDPVLVNEVHQNFSGSACALIRDLCLEFGARLMVTSSWRNVFSTRQLKAILAIVGLGEFMIGATPFGILRPQVIRSSLEDLGISSFVVVDDMDMKHDFGIRSVSPQEIFDASCVQRVRRIFKSDGC